jgi:predicted NBD/HSP70 family sugar kinase
MANVVTTANQEMNAKLETTANLETTENLEAMTKLGTTAKLGTDPNPGTPVNPATGIGIDVGGTNIRALLGTADGEIIAERRMETAKSRDRFLRQLDDIVARLAEIAVARTGAPPCGVGIGLPGKVSAAAIKWVPNLPELNGLNLRDYAAERWRLPVRLQNDGQLALYGEHWLGAARGADSAVMFTLGTGIGGAILIHGRLWSGFTGTAGSMGWITLDCRDGGDPEHGWLERAISGSALNRRTAQLAVPKDSRQWIEAARAGDPEAVALVSEVGRYLGTAVATVASVIDPEIVVIGGGLSAELDLFLPGIREALARFGSPSARRVPIAAARLLDKAGGLGALRLAFG